MAAQIEKIVTNANRADIQNFGAYSGKRFLDCIPWRFVTLRECGSFKIRHWKCAAIDFSSGSKWEGIEEHETRGHHITRQPFTQICSQVAYVETWPFNANEVSDQMRFVLGILPVGNKRLIYCRVLQERQLDFVTLYSIAADFYSRIFPA